MKKLIVLAMLAIPMVVWAQSTMFPEKEAQNKARACIPVAGTAQEVTSTAGASDTSTELNPSSLYMLVCDEDAYVEWGTTSAGTVAASGNFILYRKVMMYFATGKTNTDDANFFAARNVTTDGSCWLLECR